MSELGRGESFDDEMEYYLILKTLQDERFEEVLGCATSIVYKGGDINSNIYFRLQSFDSEDFYPNIKAFCINSKYPSDYRADLSEKDLLNNVFQSMGYSNIDSDTEYLKQITAKEYYSLID